MAAPYDQNIFSFRHQSRAGNNDPLLPHVKENAFFNAGTNDFVRPVERGENSLSGFAPMQFRPGMMHQPPPCPAQDILVGQNGSGVPNRLTRPVQIAEKMNVGPSPTDFPPRFLSPPPVSGQPFNNQRIRPSFVPQQQMILDSAMKRTDCPEVKTEAVQSVGPGLEDRRWIEQWLNQIKRKNNVSESQQPINVCH